MIVPKAKLVRTLRIARSRTRQAMQASEDEYKDMANNACNEAYASAEKLALDGIRGWQPKVRKLLIFAGRLERLTTKEDSNAQESLTALTACDE